MPKPKPDMKEAIRKLVAESRVAQGLPPMIVDQTVINKVVRLIYFWRDPQTRDSSSPGGPQGK